jgi:cytochrome P450 family 9
MYDFVANVGKQTVLTLKQQIDEGHEKDFEFKELATKFTVDNIASCAFGIEINSFSNPDNDFYQIASQFANFGRFKTVIKFIGYMVFPRIMKFFKIKLFGDKISKFFQEAIIDTIRIREEKGIIRHDMINLLMQAKNGDLIHEKEKEGALEGFATVEESQMGKSQVKRKWDDLDLAAQCFIFFLAGFDTVATTMGFIGYELACNPEIQQRLYEEIAEAERAQEGKPLTYEKLQGLMYLDQVICEVLRKWPPAPGTDRTCVKDYELQCDEMKFTIEKGTNFFIPIWGIHR